MIKQFFLRLKPSVTFLDKFILQQKPLVRVLRKKLLIFKYLKFLLFLIKACNIY